MKADLPHSMQIQPTIQLDLINSLFFKYDEFFLMNKLILMFEFSQLHVAKTV